jgi:hypothetical protein
VEEVMASFPHWYIWLSSLVTFGCLLCAPSKMKATDNVGGSLVAALLLGWLIWPGALAAALRGAIPQGRKTNG